MKRTVAVFPSHSWNVLLNETCSLRFRLVFALLWAGHSKSCFSRIYVRRTITISKQNKNLQSAHVQPCCGSLPFTLHPAGVYRLLLCSWLLLALLFLLCAFESPCVPPPSFFPPCFLVLPSCRHLAVLAC